MGGYSPKHAASPVGLTGEACFMTEGLNCSPDSIGAILNRSASPKHLNLSRAERVDGIEILVGSVSHGRIADPYSIKKKKCLVPSKSSDKRRPSSVIGFLDKNPGSKSQSFR